MESSRCEECCSECDCKCHSHGELHGRLEVVKIAFSAIVFIVGLLLTWTGTGFFRGWIVGAWFGLSALVICLPMLGEMWQCIRNKDYFNEFTLMIIASVGAFCIKEYPEGAAVLLFYSVGEMLQGKAVKKARADISALVDVRPETATVILLDGKAKVCLSADVRPGDIVEVKAGERVPLDGTLLGEKAAFNTSALTGESVPRTIDEGGEVLAGMIVSDKVVRVRVTRRESESALARILKMVEEASERKAPAEMFVRKFARVYTPVVTGVAVLVVLLPYLYSLLMQGSFVYNFGEWLYRALVFLVVSCPCALVVSIPLGYFGGIGTASHHGILFKGGNYIDTIAKVNTVVFDKTGTLTKGNFEVSRVETVDGYTGTEVAALIAAVERHSSHPIAKAIVRYVSGADNSHAVSHVSEVAGCGMTAEVDGRKVLVGNTALLDSNDVAYPKGIQQIPDTIVCCAVDGLYAGYVVLADSAKDDAAKAVANLKAEGITDLNILSGDRSEIVNRLAHELGIPYAYGDLLPEDKVHQFEKIKQGRIAAYVGDGINDAPVLALSDVGIAMGGLGSDAAVETADVVIQTDQPSKVAEAVRIGRRTRAIVMQNIVFALGVKLLVLLLGVSGHADLWWAVFADTGVTLLAVANTLRLRSVC